MHFRRHPHTLTAGHAVWNRHALRLPGVVFGVLLLMMQVLAPAMAQASAGGEWVVICSELGPVEVRVSLDDGSPVNDTGCPECEACVLCVAGDQVITPQVSHVSLFVVATLSLDWAENSVQSVNPAQYWPDCRGPPLAKIILKTRTGHAPLASIHNTGEAPCS